MTTSESQSLCILTYRYITNTAVKFFLMLQAIIFLSFFSYNPTRPPFAVHANSPFPMEFSHASFAPASADSLPRRKNVRLAAQSALQIDCRCRRRIFDSPCDWCVDTAAALSARVDRAAQTLIFIAQAESSAAPRHEIIPRESVPEKGGGQFEMSIRASGKVF